MPSQLPPELCDRIIDHLHDDRTALASCSLTCHSWLPTARYHRFRETRIEWKNYHFFLELLAGSPGIAQAISSLEISSSHPKSTVWRGEQFAFLAQLPAISTLTLSNLGIEGSVFAAFVRHLPTVKRLDVQFCWFETCDDLIALVASFPALEVLAVDGIAWTRRRRRNSSAANEPWEAPVPPALRELEVRTTETDPQLYDPQLFYDWLCGPERATPLRTLFYYVQSACDTVDLQALLFSVASTLKEFHLLVDQHEELEAILGSTEFTLAPCTALTSCALRFDVREMCVPENKSLPWVAQLLRQLSSSDLDTIKLSIRIDDMEDLRNIASECTVRKLTHARFDDLRALDWVGIERTLSHERFNSLRTLRIEGRGNDSELNKYIKERCPDLHRRGIVVYKAR